MSSKYKIAEEKTRHAHLRNLTKAGLLDEITELEARLCVAAKERDEYREILEHLVDAGALLDYVIVDPRALTLINQFNERRRREG